MERVENIEASIFIDGPAEFLTFKIAAELAKVPQFKKIFGEFIDGYKRMDYGFMNLPALRLYNNSYRKEFESWYINGEIIMDCIYPPSVHRDEMQRAADIITNALLQQFRRPSFLSSLRGLLPGLNELGKSFDVDKSLAFEFEESLAPLTQMRLNFRINLEEWDKHLMETDRTKDDPFEETLGSLDKVVTIIEGLKENSEKVQVTVSSEQATTGGQ